MKGKTAVALFVIVFLLAAAVVGVAVTGRDSGPAVSPTPGSGAGDAQVILPAETPAPERTPSPAYTAPPVQPTAPAVTQPPVSTPAPTQPPVVIPTPLPTEPPVVLPPVEVPAAGELLASGGFQSDTGVGLNIRADWTARTVSDSQVEITLSISVDSYSLHLLAVPDSINVNFNGQYLSLDAPAVDYDGPNSRNTPLASKTFTVDLASGSSGDYFVEVVWNFGGSYQQVELPAIECGGTISISR